MALSLPALPGVRDCQFRLVSNAQRFVSPLTGVGQSVARKGDFWAADLSLPPLTKTQAREWAGLLGRLISLREAVFVGPPILQADLAGLSIALVDGAGQTGSSLRVDGLANGTEIPAGAFFSVETPTFRALHMVHFTTVKSPSFSYVVLPIVPPLRASPADNAALNFTDPTCEMGLEGASADLLSLNNAETYGLTLSLAERVRA